MQDNENNNADFQSTVEEVYPTLKPAPHMTLEEFVNKAKNLLDEMLTDHPAAGDDEVIQSWDAWAEDLTSAYVNS